MSHLLKCIHKTPACQTDVKIGLIFVFHCVSVSDSSSYLIQKGPCFPVPYVYKEVHSLLVSSYSLQLGDYFWLR